MIISDHQIGCIRHAVERCEALTRFCHNARLEANNNRVRLVALGRKNYLFAGSETSAERAAPIYTLIQAARLNFVHSEAWRWDVLTHITDGHPVQFVSAILASGFWPEPELMTL